MKRPRKSASPQLKLPLLDRAPTDLPQNEQQELSRALLALLVNAATPSADQRRPTGGQHEFETHE